MRPSRRLLHSERKARREPAATPSAWPRDRAAFLRSRPRSHVVDSGEILARYWVRVVTMIDLLPITMIDVSRGLQRALVPVASSLLSRTVVPACLLLAGNDNGPMISLGPSLITEHHSESSLNDFGREASPGETYWGRFIYLD